MAPVPGRTRRRLAWASLGVVSLLVAAFAVFVLHGDQGNVSNPDVEFEADPPTAPETSQRVTRSREDPFDDGFEWPVYGFTKAQTRYLPLKVPLRPPFNWRWSVRGSVLLEFTPVLCGRQVFLLKNNGALYAVSRRTGRVRWKRKLGSLAASAPACSHGTVYAVLLERFRGSRAGRVVAVRAHDGRTRWSRKMPSRVESSPLLDRGRLYFGSEDGTVYALRARDGAVRWRAKAAGAVKGALALEDGKLFLGDYGGRVTAIRKSDGRKVWQTGTSGRFGLSSGNFYSTPAVAYGRVYLGNTDGFVYSFSARTGQLAWRRKTGGYVYSSPAVAPFRGGTVYIGSYDGRLYALSARTGQVRWSRRTGGRISGGPVVVGDLVFYSNLGRRSTAAVGATTGKLVWSVGRGAFNPVISDGRRLYLNGYSSLFMLTAGRPGAEGERRLTAAQRRARAARARKRAVARRVARRHRQIRVNAFRRRHDIEVCFRSRGRKVCRLPRPLVCFKVQPSGRTVCRPRKPVVCFERDGRRVCRPRAG